MPTRVFHVKPGLAWQLGIFRASRVLVHCVTTLFACVTGLFCLRHRDNWVKLGFFDVTLGFFMQNLAQHGDSGFLG